MGFLSGITGAAGGIGGANVLIGADTRMLRGQVREGMRQVKGELEAGAANAERTASRWNSAFGAIGTAMKVGMLGAVAALGAGIGAAIQFESAWAGVRKTVEATPAELAKLRQAFRDLALEIPVSVNELAAIGETGGAMGIAKESLVEFTKVVATIGQTTNVTTDAAATALGQLSNVLHLTDEDYARFASTLVDLGNKGASTESQILEMAARAGSAAGLVGIAAKDVLAYASATASLGIEVEAGGTSLQSFFLKANAIVGAGSGITKAAKDAGMSVEKFVGIVMKGGKGLTQLADATGLTTKKLKELVTSSSQLEVMARVAGMTGEAFAQAFEKDAAGALQVFLAGLGKLKGAEQQGVLKDLKLGDVRMTRTLLGLANGADLLANNLDNAAAAWDANTAAADEAAKRYETTGSQLGLLKNLIQDYLITLGDAALPAVKGLLKALRDDLPKAITFLANIWTTILYPAVSGMLGAFGELGHSIGLLFGQKDEAANWGSVLATVATGAANGLAAVAKAIGAIVTGISWLLRNPIGGFVAKLVALAVAFKAITSGFGALRGSLTASSQGLLRSIGLGGLMPSSSAGSGGDPALNASAGKLDQAAAHLERAAGAIGRGGVAGVPNTAGPGMRPSPTGTGAFIDASGAYRGTEQAVAAEIALRARMKAAEDAAKRAGQNMVQRAAGDLANGIKTGASKLKGAAVSGLGMVGNLFWPVMIAGVATEILKAPLGDFVMGNSRFRRAGQKIKEDFFGGLMALMTAQSTGTDAFVAMPTLGLGNRTFNTEKLGRTGGDENPFDLTDKEIADLQSGGLVGALTSKEVAPRVKTALNRGKHEALMDWAERIKAQLEASGMSSEEVQAVLRQYGGVLGSDLISSTALEQNSAAVTSAFNRILNNYLTGFDKSINAGITSAMTSTLESMGINTSNAALLNLPKDVYTSLAKLLVDGVEAGWDPTVLALEASRLANAKPPSTTPFVPNASLTPRQNEGVAAALNLGGLQNQQGRLSADIAAAFPTPTAEQGRQAGIQYFKDFEAGIKKAGKDPDAQQAFLDSVNLMRQAAGLNKITWEELIDWTAKLGDDTFVTAQRQLNQKLKTASVEAARLGVAGAGDEFWHWWGEEVSNADTKAERVKLRNKINEAIPDEANDMDAATFAAWLKSVMGTVDGVTHGSGVHDWMTGELPDKPDDSEVTRVAQWLRGTVKKGTTEALSGKLEDDLVGAGYNIMDHIADGIESKESKARLKSAIKTAVGSMLGHVPSSPVKEGPLKHPFLPNAGKKMMEQIAAGMASSPLKMPSMTGTSISGMKLAGAGALVPPPGQVLNIDRLQLFDKADEKSILARTAFMSPAGRID